VGGENPCLKAYCIDPVVTTSALLGCGGSLHMSGTLTPLNEYRDSIGLPMDTSLVSFPSPFPKENRRVFYVQDVSTKYEEMQSSPEMVEAMEDHVVQVCNGVRRNTVVFFPSYALMDRFLADGVSRRISRKVHVEERGMAQLELMDVVTQFKRAAPEGRCCSRSWADGSARASISRRRSWRWRWSWASPTPGRRLSRRH